jgi:hypothetical protein
MKNLRKVLAVVLVVCMAFSLMVMASAKTSADYGDAASITYKEAVDVFSGAGIMTGGDGTNWNPTGTFTREQAAKVIASLLSANAGKFKVSVSSFSDVAVTDWSSPYIEYCASKGIINGTGDGTFAPKAPVTGSAFAKMLLTALGYGKNNEYVGSNWEINVLDDALRLKILTLDVNYSAAATREQVALYALNAIGLIQQKYSKDTDIYSNVDLNPTLGDKIGLKMFDATANGVAGYVYKLNGVAITPVYTSDIVLASIKDGTAISAFTKTSSTKYVAPFGAAVTYTFNGAATYNGDTVSTVAHGGVTVAGKLYIGTDHILRVAQGVTADYNGLGGNDDLEYSKRGAIVTLIDDPDTVAKDVFKVNIIEKKVGYIAPLGTGVTVTPVLNLPSTVKIDLDTVADIEGTEKTVVGYENLAKGDVVLYYTVGTMIYVEKATTFTGTVTAIAGTTYTIGGTSYKMSQLPQTAGTVELGNTTSTYYVDNGGYIVYITGVAPAVTDKYALVLASSASAANPLTGTSASNKAQLLLTDGTKAVFDVMTGPGGTPKAAALVVGSLVKYLANGSTITKVDEFTAIDIDANMVVTNKATTVALDETGEAAVNYYMTSSTVYFFYNSATEYGVVVGNANVPTTTVVLAEDVYADVTSAAPLTLKAVVLPNAPGSISGLPTYAYVTDATPTQTLENGATVFTYSAIVNGTATTLKSSTDEDDDGDDLVAGLYSVVETNGFYAFTDLVLEKTAATPDLIDAAYVLFGADLYNIKSTTLVYKATKVAGAVTALTADTLAFVPGSTLKADVETDGAGNATIIIFWYE